MLKQPCGTPLLLLLFFSSLSSSPPLLIFPFPSPLHLLLPLPLLTSLPLPLPLPRYVRLVRHYGYLYILVLLGWMTKALLTLPHDWHLGLLLGMLVGVPCLTAGLVHAARPPDGGLSLPPGLEDTPVAHRDH
jgi:hypothetical protein